jgi:hypothetical protein
MTFDLFLSWPKYQLFPYEKAIAIREAKALLKPLECAVRDKGIFVRTVMSPRKACELTYISSVTHDGHVIQTTQARLEASSLNGNGHGRQSTRYSVHGIHDYKGKFNPQVARAILNCFRLGTGARILDPFCGSGTTLVESAQRRLEAVGLDLNPLAVYIASAKLFALSTPVADLRRASDRAVGSLGRLRLSPDASPRYQYLRSWFREDLLHDIEKLRIATEAESPAIRQVLRVLISDLLRDYSLQEPLDLRIRRRLTPMPRMPFPEAFQARVDHFLAKLTGAQALLRRVPFGLALPVDITDISDRLARKIGKFDAVISSPPYATALPYIDTQRLSLIWLGLCDPSDLSRLQSGLIGSREFSGRQKADWMIAMASNTHRLARDTYSYCVELQRALSPQDGFRRMAVPRLLYRYFVGMQRSLESLNRLMNPGALGAFIMGHNHTVLGGRRFDIGTPGLLIEVIKNAGFEHIETLALETYRRYGIHYRNAVSKEELILFRRR